MPGGRLSPVVQPVDAVPAGAASELALAAVSFDLLPNSQGFLSPIATNESKVAGGLRVSNTFGSSGQDANVTSLPAFHKADNLLCDLLAGRRLNKV